MSTGFSGSIRGEIDLQDFNIAQPRPMIDERSSGFAKLARWCSLKLAPPNLAGAHDRPIEKAGRREASRVHAGAR
jgi:hypothetical protein